MHSCAKRDVVDPLAVDIDLVPVLEHALIYVSGRIVEQRHVAGSHVEAAPCLVLHDRTHDRGDRVAAQQFLHRMWNLLWLVAQSLLQLLVHRQIAHAERHRVGDGIEPSKKQEDAVR